MTKSESISERTKQGSAINRASKRKPRRVNDGKKVDMNFQGETVSDGVSGLGGKEVRYDRFI